MVYFFKRSKDRDSLKISTPEAGKTLAGMTSPMTNKVTCHPSCSSCHSSWSSCHPPPFCNRPTPSVSWRRQNAFKMRNLNLRLPSLPPQLSNASSPDKRFQRQGHVLRRLLDKDQVCWVFLTFLLILNSSSSSSCPLPHSHHLRLSPVLSPAA